MQLKRQIGSTAISMIVGFALCTTRQVACAQEPHRAVLTAEQVVQILDETVDWYRTLGTQQQAADQPSDLLILYANRQTGNKVMDLAFEIARANAELLSSEEDSNKDDLEAASSTQTMSQAQSKVDLQVKDIQTEMESDRRTLTTAVASDRPALQGKIAELQGELDLANARHNLLDTISEFSNGNSAHSARAGALKLQIDAIAGSIPSLNTAPTAATNSAASIPALNTVPSASNTLGRFGIWDLASNVIRLSQKISTIEAIDQRTLKLQATFATMRNPPLEQLKILSTRGDVLAAKADTVTGAALKAVRDQFDTLAWLFKQTSAMIVPLSKEGVLLSQYRHNLVNWRSALSAQYRQAWKALASRIGIFAALLVLVFVAAELWRRTVFRYVHDSRRRFQLLLVRKIALWALVIAIVASAFASELGSLVTFAGLITAGLAVAMQSILVSIVGYFFLIGKYGIRVGDRVQIGTVSGEVIELGLVRLHLMELNDRGSLGPTGRVVAFANSIVFQSSGGLFKQIPGVDIAWHDTTLKLPQGCDTALVKDKLLAAVTGVVQEYRVEIERQSKEIQKNTASKSGTDVTPQVQLHFSNDGVEALVRYPVNLKHSAEIDERVSRELLGVISNTVKTPAHN